jgi:teichuronic acid biosynthesis glycosyltransferase TuaH
MSRDVIFTFSFVSWGSVQRRGMCMPEDRIVETLLEHPKVGRLLVCENFRSAPRSYAARVLRRPAVRFPASERVALCSPLRLRKYDPTDPVALERTYVAYERSVQRAAARLGMERPAVIVAHPALAGFGRFDWSGPVTYFATDDWESAPQERAWWPAYRTAMQRLREQGRRVAAVSAEIVERIAPTGPTLVVPNGIDADEWLAPASAPRWFAQRPGPRLLYVGSIDARLDPELVRAAARAVPDGSVTIVGPLLDEALRPKLEAEPNVAIHPAAPRAEIVALIAAADACLIPHARTPLTESMSPLKLYEYLAGGRPIAAVDLPPIARVGHPRVALAEEGPEAFAAAVRRALEIGPATGNERLRFLRDNGWRSRHEPLLELAFR